MESSSEEKQLLSPNIFSGAGGALASHPNTTLLATTVPTHQPEHYSTAFTAVTTAVPSASSNLASLPLFSPSLPQVTAVDIKDLQSISGRNILNVEMFTKSQLQALFNLAQAFRFAVHKDRCLDGVLRVIIWD